MPGEDTHVRRHFYCLIARRAVVCDGSRESEICGRWTTQALAHSNNNSTRTPPQRRGIISPTVLNLVMLRPHLARCWYEHLGDRTSAEHRGLDPDLVAKPLLCPAAPHWMDAAADNNNNGGASTTTGDNTCNVDVFVERFAQRRSDPPQAALAALVHAELGAARLQVERTRRWRLLRAAYGCAGAATVPRSVHEHRQLCRIAGATIVAVAGASESEQRMPRTFHDLQSGAGPLRIEFDDDFVVASTNVCSGDVSAHCRHCDAEIGFSQPPECLCGTEWYCSNSCAAADWDRHRATCGAVGPINSRSGWSKLTALYWDLVRSGALHWVGGMSDYVLQWRTLASSASASVSAPLDAEETAAAAEADAGPIDQRELAYYLATEGAEFAERLSDRQRACQATFDEETGEFDLDREDELVAELEFQFNSLAWPYPSDSAARLHFKMVMLRAIHELVYESDTPVLSLEARRAVVMPHEAVFERFAPFLRARGLIEEGDEEDE